MTTINHEPDSYCLPLAQSTSHKPEKCSLRLLRSTYHGSHPWCVVLIITSIRTCLNLFELFEQVRKCPNFTCQVRTGSITSMHISNMNTSASRSAGTKISITSLLPRIWCQLYVTIVRSKFSVTSYFFFILPDSGIFNSLIICFSNFCLEL